MELCSGNIPISGWRACRLSFHSATVVFKVNGITWFRENGCISIDYKRLTTQNLRIHSAVFLRGAPHIRHPCFVKNSQTLRAPELCVDRTASFAHLDNGSDCLLHLIRTVIEHGRNLQGGIESVVVFIRVGLAWTFLIM